MIDCILSLIGYLMMTFAGNVAMLCASKFLLGTQKKRYSFVQPNKCYFRYQTESKLPVLISLTKQFCKISGYVSLTSRSVIQPFICEISNPNIRRFTTSLYVLFYILGKALSLLVARQGDLEWRYATGIMFVLMIVCFMGFLVWIHDAPDWLLER